MLLYNYIDNKKNTEFIEDKIGYLKSIEERIEKITTKIDSLAIVKKSDESDQSTDIDNSTRVCEEIKKIHNFAMIEYLAARYCASELIKNFNIDKYQKQSIVNIFSIIKGKIYYIKQTKEDIDEMLEINNSKNSIINKTISRISHTRSKFSQSRISTKFIKPFIDKKNLFKEKND